MIFTDIYDAIVERLLTGDDPRPVKMVDWYNGQPEELEGGGSIDGLLYPLALVRFEPVTWNALSHGMYEGDAVVYVDVVHNHPAHRTSNVGPEEKTRSSAQLETVMSVSLTLDRLAGAGFSSFQLAMNEMDHTFKKIRVDTMAFKTHLTVNNDPREWIKVSPPLHDTYSIVPSVPVDHRI